MYTHDDVLTSDAQDLSTVLTDNEQQSLLSALVGDDTDAVFNFLCNTETRNAVSITDVSEDSLILETPHATYYIPVGHVSEHDLVSPTGADDNCHISIGNVLTLTTPFKTLPEPIRDEAHNALTHH